MNISSFPQNATLHFFEIINSYGSILTRRELLKTLDVQIAEDTVRGGVLESQHKVMVEKYVSAQKYFKKLKHTFKDRFPSHYDNMLEAVKKHQKTHENANRARHSAFSDMISSLTPVTTFFKNFERGGFSSNHAFKVYVRSILPENILLELFKYNPTKSDMDTLLSTVKNMTTLLTHCGIEDMQNFDFENLQEHVNPDNYDKMLPIGTKEHNRYTKCLERFTKAEKRYKQVSFSL